LGKWEDGSETIIPLDIIIKNNRFYLANYAPENILMDTPRWKRLLHATTGHQCLNIIIQQAKITRPHKGMVYSFWYTCSKKWEESFELNKEEEETGNDGMGCKKQRD
jgi:hypothetical protein